jgi:hypothetical protein
MQGHLIPNWITDQFKSLDYTLDHHKDTQLIDRYVAAGHDPNSMQMRYCFENQLSSVDTTYIRNHFKWLDNLALAVNLFTPGQYLPLHYDLYQQYRSVFKLDETIKISRIILMLEDSCPGQILQFENRVVGNWKAGDWFGWIGNELHAFYNFSMIDRYAIQITGTQC